MKAKKVLTNLAAFILSGFIIAYIIIQLASGLTTDATFTYADKVTTEDTLEATAYIFRRETLLKADAQGVINYSVDESQKISANQLIATVYSSADAVDIQNRVNQIDTRIEILEKSAVDTSYLTSDISKIDSKIYSSLFAIKRNVSRNDLSFASQSKKDLLINFNKRRLITNNAAGFDNQIASLKNERNALTSNLNTPLATVLSPVPGYFSTLLDGYEGIFTTDALADLSVDSFHSILNVPPQKHDSEVIGKIITDFDWYTVCAVSKDETEELDVGSSYPISYIYSSSQQLSGMLEKKIVQTDTDTVILVFRIDQVPKEFDYARQQPVKITKTSYTGLSIPKSSLRVVDGTTGVYILGGNVVEFRKVEILYSSDTTYICRIFSSGEEGFRDHLSQFDYVITSGKDLYAGKILD